MHERATRALAVGWTLLEVVRRSPLTLLAAAIAYYAFVSLLPLSLLALSIASALGGDALAETVVAQLGGVLTPSGEELVRSALTTARGRGGATALGLAVLLWGGLKLFRGLDVAFSMIYGTQRQVTLFTQLRNAVTALFAVGVAVGAVVLAAALAGLVSVSAPTVIALPIVLTAAFLPLYVIFPDVDLRVREALPGAAFAALGWTALSAVFQVYAASAGGSALYGVLGAVLLLVTWFYVGGLLLLVGAVLNGVLAGDVGSVEDRQLQQGAHRDTEQRMSDSGADDADGGTGESRQREDRDLQAELEELQTRIDERTLHRDEIERDLKRYVRKRVRRGHAAGWGPYLVLLYGTVMTLGAFYFLSGWVAFLSMIVIWLSTLGLYALMLLVGVTVSAAGLPGALLDKARDFRR
ncbi:putative conserved domain associated withmembrane ribonuclease BN [Halapricum desulfuricans]|uniref:Putative conserved domain associated withmembrane ribonuclease BN n=1 Tax=Halapricum desulfuricans TaxID=2841257 RepID=A0A897NGP8_9EURY|nr:YihY/virulence factor BrkB family protein [Halapricum desulfuricans]QSG10625.1 putative conserved domain associated withmembrane ribonuclease BN [Halapricum desulfuricans]